MPVLPYHKIFEIYAPLRSIVPIICGCVFAMVFYIPNLESQRTAVLNQIDLPHSYYYRELYLPQLTSGPSSVTWSPDGRALIFSMSGSLWWHQLESDSTVQLTDGHGFDYQPDWSPDGKQVAFTRYDGESMEIMLLEFSNRQVFNLTSNGAVNVEPKWSPDGDKLAFVSTMNTGHFLLFLAKVHSRSLFDYKCLTPDRKSEVKRYYYSAYDHAINPAWSRDGKKIYFVSNREIAHGTGDITSIELNGPGRREIVHHEETSWRARPDLSPDGTRMVYSSYLGRNWHQLWMLPANGGYPMPLTYGDYDNTQAKWSPDGKQIAFISNRTGNTSLWTLDVYSGKQKEITFGTLIYLTGRTTLDISLTDQSGKPVSGRISIRDENEKFYAPHNALIYADDSRYPSNRQYEQQYFYTDGKFHVDIPETELYITAAKGPDYEIVKTTITPEDIRAGELTLEIAPITLPSTFGTFWSGDLHVHMNYGGHYRNTPGSLVRQSEAENLNFVYNLIVNKEQRIPDIAYFSNAIDEASTENILLFHSQEFHTSFWGHLGLLHLDEHFIIPDYAGYPGTAAESLFPHNPFIADLAHDQNGLVGYVHPFLGSQLYPEQSETLTNDLPVNAALGKIDYYELIGFADHIPSADVWYKLLNCGLRISAGAGTDVMGNYASLRGPLGLNRVYVRGDGRPHGAAIRDRIKAGNGFVTNGPLLGLEIEGYFPGDEMALDTSEREFVYKLSMRSNVPVDLVELIYNGKIVASHTNDANPYSQDLKGVLKIDQPGWVLARAWRKEAHPDLMDSYPYGSTNPVYIAQPGQQVASASAAKYFIKWVDRLIKMSGAKHLYRTEEERRRVLKDLNKARIFYVNCLENATIE